MKKFFLSSIFIFFSCFLMAQTPFEGTIEFKKQTATDTSHYIYYVKENKVRLDEIGNNSKKIVSTFIVDTKAKKVLSLNHERKLYMEKSKGGAADISGSVQITKTKNAQTILGYKCIEYTVKNTTENTMISYWVAKKNFDFFLPFLTLINQKQKFASYFLQLENMEMMFPFLAVESNLEGVEKGRMEVTKIEKMEVESSIFEIPAEYKKFDK